MTHAPPIIAAVIPTNTASADAERLPPSVLDRSGVERAYARLADVYDLLFGLALHHGRTTALARMDLRPGMRVLEVGVGTGLNARLYPDCVHVVGIDLSASMLRKAQARLGSHNAMRLCRTDATSLPFPAGVFDIVYAPYVMNAVPDAQGVAREMRRVARPGGRLVFLNHFRSPRPVMQPIEHLVTQVTRHLGFTWDLSLERFLTEALLTPELVEGVNIPRFSKLVICRVP